MLLNMHLSQTDAWRDIWIYWIQSNSASGAALDRFVVELSDQGTLHPLLEALFIRTASGVSINYNAAIGERAAPPDWQHIQEEDVAHMEVWQQPNITGEPWVLHLVY